MPIVLLLAAGAVVIALIASRPIGPRATGDPNVGSLPSSPFAGSFSRDPASQAVLSTGETVYARGKAGHYGERVTTWRPDGGLLPRLTSLSGRMTPQEVQDKLGYDLIVEEAFYGCFPAGRPPTTISTFLARNGVTLSSRDWFKSALMNDLFVISFAAMQWEHGFAAFAIKPSVSWEAAAARACLDLRSVIPRLVNSQKDLTEVTEPGEIQVLVYYFTQALLGHILTRRVASRPELGPKG